MARMNRVPAITEETGIFEKVGRAFTNVCRLRHGALSFPMPFHISAQNAGTLL